MVSVFVYPACIANGPVRIRGRRHQVDNLLVEGLAHLVDLISLPAAVLEAVFSVVCAVRIPSLAR
jgi:hypothetical protein